jgi:hypothetical protein
MTPKARAWELVSVAVAEGDPEEVLTAIADWLRLDMESESDGNVRACLQSAAEHCDHAALDYYASTK